MNNQECRYLIFSLKDTLFALDLAQVAEVSEPPATWPIPSAPAHFRGAMNFHGVIVAVMDLPAFMGIAGCRPPEKLIVLDNRLAALGLLVEQVARIVGGHEVSAITGQDEGFSSGYFDFSGKKVTLLDPARIVARATETING